MTVHIYWFVITCGVYLQALAIIYLRIGKYIRIGISCACAHSGSMSKGSIVYFLECSCLSVVCA